MRKLIIQRNDDIALAINHVLSVVRSYIEIDPSFHESCRRMNSEAKELLEQIESKSFSVAVIATIKAGKSTFLNSLIGNEYLPTSNVPETSSLLFIRHNTEVFLQSNSEVIHGLSNIRESIRDRNRRYRESGIDVLDTYILNIPYDKLRDVDGLNFQFIDTPGPNEAGAISLQDEVQKVLRMADVVVYLLDYTKLNSNDEHMLFKTISDLRQDLILEIKDRLFFVVNKYDTRNANSLTVDETVRFVSDSLKRSMGLATSKIHCVSAERALLARMIANANYDRINDLGFTSFGVEGWDETMPLDQRINMFEGKLEGILNRSGIPALENDIIDYIVNNSESIFYRSIVDKTLRTIKETENLLSAKLSLLHKDDRELKRAFKELNKKVGLISRDLENVDRIIKSFSREIEAEVDRQFDNYEETIIALIDKAMHYRNSDLEVGNASFEEYVDTGADLAIEFLAPGDNGSQKAQNKKILRQIYSFGKSGLKSITSLVGGWNSSVDPDEARERIEQINQRIYELVRIGFSAVRQELEMRASVRSNDINLELQKIINRANNELFRAINCELKLSDDFAAVEIELPKDDSFKLSMDYDKFIVKTMKDMPGGFCQPKQRVVDSVELKADLLVSWWIRELDKQKVASLRAVKSYMREAVVDKIEVVKKEFTSNADTYLKMILSQQNELKENQAGKADCQQALEQSVERLKLIVRTMGKHGPA